MDTPIRTIAIERAIESVAVSNDVAAVASEPNNANETVHIYDLITGTLLQTMKPDGYSATAVALSPNGRLAVASTNGSKAVLWDAHTGALLKSVPAPGVGSDNSGRVAFSPDNQLIASAYLGHLVIFDTALAQKNKFKIINPGGRASSLASSPEGRFLAAGFSRLDNGATLILYDLVSGQVKFTVVTSQRIGVTSVAWTSNNILAGNGDGSINLWDGQSGAAISRTFPKHARPVMAMAVSQTAA